MSSSRPTRSSSRTSNGATSPKSVPRTTRSSPRKTVPMRDVDEPSGDEEESKEQPACASSVPPRFAGKTLYEVLGVDQQSSSEVIKKAYRRMALSCHPDLNKSVNATEEFRYLSRCHEILADATKRSRYDATGSIDGADAASDDMDAYEYWRAIFPKISIDDIEAYRSKYEGGEEEKEDLLQAYEQFDGDLESIFESVPFASASSVVRLCTLLNSHADAKITKKAMNSLKATLDASEGDEAEEAEAAMAQLSAKDQKLLRGGASDGLALILQQRQKERAQSGKAFLSHMESKFSELESKLNTNGRSSKRKGEPDEDEDENAGAPTTEMTDEEFEAIQAKIMARKVSNGASGKKKPSPKKKTKRN